jgi:hypothetical protein
VGTSVVRRFRAPHGPTFMAGTSPMASPAQTPQGVCVRAVQVAWERTASDHESATPPAVSSVSVPLENSFRSRRSRNPPRLRERTKDPLPGLSEAVSEAGRSFLTGAPLATALMGWPGSMGCRRSGREARGCAQLPGALVVHVRCAEVERRSAVLCGVIIGMTNHFRAVFDRLGGMAQAL